MEESEKVRIAITNLLKSTGRANIEELIDKMVEGGFFNSPCSTAYHLSVEGGLAKHSLNVFQIASRMNHALGNPVPDNTLIIITLLHDLGKMGDYGKPNYVPNLLKNGKPSETKPYETNKSLSYIAHEIRSIGIAERYIELTEDEEFAILYHNGLYGSLKYDIQGKETPMYMILHFADMWASRVVDDEQKGEKE